jgi:chromate transporter
MSTSVGIVEILLVILISTFFSIGGGNGPLAVIQDQWVKSGALDAGLFAWVFALSYLAPGPRVGFLSGIGYYLHGLPGAMAAIIGIVIPTCIGASAVSYGLKKLQPIIKKISLSAGFVISGMIAVAAWGTALPLRLGVGELIAVLIVAFIVAKWKTEPIWIILGGAVFGLMVWAWI